MLSDTSVETENELREWCDVLIYRFDLLQVKRNLISSIINFVYELSNELPNDLKHRILGN